MSNFEPFITGSHRYGTPNDESDIDLVVHMPEAVVKALFDASGAHEAPKYGNGDFTVFRFGELNIIATHTRPAYTAWRDGTDKCVAQLLKKRRPLTRDEALTIIRRELDNRGIDE